MLELLDLRFVGQPADYGEDAVVCGCGDGRAYLADLLGEFARGCDHEHKGSLAAFGMVEPIERRQREGGGLAGARLCGGDEIASFERKGDGLFLDGCGRFVAQTCDGLQGLVGQAEFAELFHVSILWFLFGCGVWPQIAGRVRSAAVYRKIEGAPNRLRRSAGRSL